MNGIRVGKWLLGKRLGKGGNGEVYRASCGTQTGALKRLRADRRGGAAASRFVIEIKAMRDCQDIAGVLRLLDSHIGCAGEPSWIVTELAQPFRERLADSDFDEVLGAVAALARTLAEMHARGYSHRDIKPDNLFWSAKGWAVGDFGLVSHPEKAQLTREGAKLGPLHYMAPEMLDDASSADGMSADVYSLAKVLWVVASGQVYPMPGQLHRDTPELRLSSLVGGIRPQRLDAILHAATHPRPAARPSMRDLQRELEMAGKSIEIDVPAKVALPAALAAELSTRSGYSERLEQDRVRQDAQRAEHRILEWQAKRFFPVMTQLNEALSQVEGLQHLTAVGPANNDSDLSSAGGLPEHVEGRAYFQSSVSGSIRRSSGTYLDFAFGVRLDVATQRIEYSDGTIELPVDTQPVVVHAAYVMGHLRRLVSVLWSTSASFLMGGSEDELECARLGSALLDNFASMLQALADEARNT